MMVSGSTAAPPVGHAVVVAPERRVIFGSDGAGVESAVHAPDHSSDGGVAAMRRRVLAGEGSADNLATERLAAPRDANDDALVQIPVADDPVGRLV